jgi:hypothetical protein
MTWQQSRLPVPAPNQALGGSVRVTRHDGFQVVLGEAEIHGDSIVGIEQVRLRRKAIALAEVERMESRRVDPVNSALVGAGAALAVFGAGMLAILAILSTDHS